MNLEDAAKRAEELRQEIDSFCLPDSACVVGSVLRRKPDPGDIELVATPDLRDYDKVDGIIKLLGSAKYGVVKTGMFPARQTTMDGGLCKIEIYWQSKQSYGLNKFIRTGPVDYVTRALAFWKLITNGGYSEGAVLHLADGTPVPTLTELCVYKVMDEHAKKTRGDKYVPVKWLDPCKRR